MALVGSVVLGLYTPLNHCFCHVEYCVTETSIVNRFGFLFPTGMAIRTLLLEAIEAVCSDLGEFPGYKRECQLLKSVANGNLVAEFSRDL